MNVYIQNNYIKNIQTVFYNISKWVLLVYVKTYKTFLIHKNNCKCSCYIHYTMYTLYTIIYVLPFK